MRPALLGQTGKIGAYWPVSLADKCRDGNAPSPQGDSGRRSLARLVRLVSFIFRAGGGLTQVSFHGHWHRTGYRDHPCGESGNKRLVRGDPILPA
jgi:hypothetical protein